jgi:hypothetical protein
VFSRKAYDCAIFHGKKAGYGLVAVLAIQHAKPATFLGRARRVEVEGRFRSKTDEAEAL